MAFDELESALKMFQAGAQQYQLQRATTEASDQLAQLNASMADAGQKRMAQEALAKQLALKLSGTGAPATTIENAVSAVAPTHYATPEAAQMGGLLGKGLAPEVVGKTLQDEQQQRELEKTKLQTQAELEKERIKGDFLLQATGMKQAGTAKKDLTKHIEDFDKLPDIKALRESLGKAGQIESNLQDPSPAAVNLAKISILRMAGDNRISNADKTSVAPSPAIVDQAWRELKLKTVGEQPMSDVDFYRKMAARIKDSGQKHLLNRANDFIKQRSALTSDPATLKSAIMSGVGSDIGNVEKRMQAEAWLSDPANAKSPQAAQVMQILRAQRGY